jgi:hypothetical protein
VFVFLPMVCGVLSQFESQSFDSFELIGKILAIFCALVMSFGFLATTAPILYSIIEWDFQNLFFINY